MFIIQIQQHRSDLFLFILFDSFFDRPYDIYVMASYVHFQMALMEHLWNLKSLLSNINKGSGPDKQYVITGDRFGIRF